MSSAYVLFFLWVHYSGIRTQEFETKESCEQAIVELNKHLGSEYPVDFAYCVKK